MTDKNIYIISGGTVNYIRPHLALAAPAYGTTGHELGECLQYYTDFQGDVRLYTTKMAGDLLHHFTLSGPEAWQRKYNYHDNEEGDEWGPGLETNDDVAKLIEKLVEDPAPKIIFMPVALCDFEAESCTSNTGGDGIGEAGKQYARLETGRTRPSPSGVGQQLPIKYEVIIRDAKKIISTIREERKDIFLVGFKTTAGANPTDQFVAGLKLLKKASCNLVLANDIRTRLNMVITPEQAPYAVTKNRNEALNTLVQMAVSRSRGHFTRSVETKGKVIDWNSKLVPDTLRTVVNYCISKGAYKPFLGSTVGHFAYKLEDGRFVTSRRKVDFNYLGTTVGMVLVEALDDDRVISYGGKPSVGGQSQRIIFHHHPDIDCIVHFHCPLKPGVIDFPTRSQEEHECGSHECGQNTSDGLRPMNVYQPEDFKLHRIKAVMLDKHGPNIVFHRDADPQVIINFIEQHWDLSRSTSELPT